jgi:hypothetical protein
MPRNGSGGYTLPPPFPFVQNSIASATDVDTVLTDIQAALAGSVSADGQTPLAGNLNVNGNRLTNVGLAVGNGDALTRSWFNQTTVFDLGNQASAQPIALQFHSNGSTTPDATLLSSGGTTTSNGGTLYFSAKSLQLNTNGGAVLANGRFLATAPAVYVFGNPGSNSFTSPPNCNSGYMLIVGGGGSGAVSGTPGNGAAGTVIRGYFNCPPSTQVNYTVGAGGTGVSSGNGNNGSTSGITLGPSGSPTAVALALGGNAGLASGTHGTGNAYTVTNFPNLELYPGQNGGPFGGGAACGYQADNGGNAFLPLGAGGRGVTGGTSASGGTGLVVLVFR